MSIRAPTKRDGVFILVVCGVLLSMVLYVGYMIVQAIVFEQQDQQKSCWKYPPESSELDEVSVGGYPVHPAVCGYVLTQKISDAPRLDSSKQVVVCYSLIKVACP